MRRLLQCSCAFAALALAFPAAGQEADDSLRLEEVVVTAQKVEQSLQRAGIAIDAVSAESLAERGISNALEITKSVPAISFTNAGGNITSIFLRGVGNVTTSSYNDPAVTPSYDGVVLGRGGGVFGSAFYDIARIEVLKGPQGILYGRNATGGAVNIIPNHPVTGEMSGGINVTVGNYDTIDVDGFANLPIGDTMALRVSASSQTHEGYSDDGSDDRDISSVRGQFLWEPADNLSVRLAADWTKQEGQGAGGDYLGSFVPNAMGTYDFIPSGLAQGQGFNTPASNAYRRTILGAPGFGFLNALQGPPSLNTTYWGVNAEVNWQTSLGAVTIIPAFRSTEDRTFIVGPAFNLGNTNEDVDQYSVEARLAGKVSALDYVVGGFYFNEEIEAANQYNQEFVLPIQHYEQKTRSYAAFGQLTWHATEQLRLIGGARYTEDKKEMDGIINNFITFCGGIPGAGFTPPPASFARGCAAPGALPHFPNFLSTGETIAWLKANGWISPTATDQPNPQVFTLTNGVAQILKTYNPVIDDGTYSRVTWKGSVEYDIGPSNLLYATVETGYRAGGFQMTEGKPRYNPEFITAYTLGSKNRFFDDRLQVNVEAFWWKYRDQQIVYFTVDPSGTLINSNENAGRSTIKGVDVDVVARPFRNTTVGAKVQYLDAKFDSIHLFTAAPRDNFNCPFTFTGQIAGGAPVKDFNCSGNPLLFSPEWTVNLDFEQVVPLNDDYELVGNFSTAWRDKQWGAFEYLPFEHIPSYWTSDVSLTLRKTDGTVAITGFVYNIEDERRNLAPQSSPIGVAVAHYSAPRTYGVRVSGKF